MTSTTNDPNESRKLSDDELDEVAGGQGTWSPWNETAYKRRWAYDNPGPSFGDWLKSRVSDDYIKARDAWLAAGSPQNLSYHYENGNLWTEPYVD